MKKGLGLVLLAVSVGILNLFPAYTVHGKGVQSRAPLEAVRKGEKTESLQNVRKAKKAKGTWVKGKKAVRFRYQKGGFAKSTWHRIRGKRYYFDEKGYRKTGWLEYQGRRYYLNSRGVMQTGWIHQGGHVYYLKKTGAMVSSKWVRYRGKRYYLKANGRMATGWQRVNGKKYYFGADGAVRTGLQFIKDQWYFFRKNGSLNRKKKVPKINPNKPMVALTFDDGPGPYTERLLGYLKEYQAKATFFLVSSSAGRYPQAIKKAFRMGCEIGNHSYSHPSLTGLSVQGIRQEIESTGQLIYKITGEYPTLLRPPYGAYNRNVCYSVDLPVILWSVDTRDWATRDAQATVSHIKTHVKDGDIILMHDIHPQTVDAVRQILPWLKEQGYQMVTVSELAKYRDISLKDGSVYTSLR